MRVFEELIEELKEEKLLEETVIGQTGETIDDDDFECSQNSETAQPPPDEILEAECIEPELLTDTDDSVSEAEAKRPQNDPTLPDKLIVSPHSFESEKEQPSQEINNMNTGSIYIEPQEASYPLPQNEPEKPKVIVNEAEFFRRRATDEVLSLQMVSHVLSGVEREVLNQTPKLYDDLPVKKALHDFIQVSGDVNSPEHAQAEFLLMQETESWYSALTQKDKKISVGSLRRYCETTRPALSPQALVSLARFYRNAPFSETVRSKFDLVITRLFSREITGNKRHLTFGRDEMMQRLDGFYAEWSSIHYYADNEDDSQVVLAALKLEDFMAADGAATFEELHSNDFFNRLKVFKESTQELFFSPLLAATMVECNVRIGNRYVELLEKEKSKADKLLEQYDEFHDQTVSEIVCKTLSLPEILSAGSKTSEPPKVKVSSIPEKEPEKPQSEENPVLPVQAVTSKKEKRHLFKLNKWLITLLVLTVLSTFGLYYWVEMMDGETKPINVKSVNLENSSLKEHIEAARISSDTFYGLVSPSWDGLSLEQKEELLRKILLIGGEKGFVRANLINRQGKTVGYASPEKIEVSNP